jgi:hypothetical protein
MQPLREQLGTGEKRRQVIDDALVVLDQEVGDKGGLTGIAIKAAYKVVKGVRPGFIREVVDGLLDEFLEAVEPLYQEAIAAKRPAGSGVRDNPSRVADSLLGVTDRKSQKAKSQVVKSAYEKLRPSAKKQVEAACPRLASLLERHAAAPS